MAINLQALKDEITLNPAAMPYPAFTPDNDVAIADILNNADGANPRTVNRDSVSSSDVAGQTTFDAYDGLTAAETAWFDWLTNRESISVTPDTLANLAGVGGTSRWGAADKATMEPRMAALMQFAGSRAQEISDTLGVSVVSPANVRDARLLP